MSIAVALRRSLLGIPAREASFNRRGFALGDQQVTAHLESVGEAFLAGYNAAISRGEPEGALLCVRAGSRSLYGFVIEGAAMAFTLLDYLAPRRPSRFGRFLSDTAADHPYMAHVGAGWALARLRVARLGYTRNRALRRFDPLLRWLVIDGYGFHEAFFDPTRVLQRQWQPAQSDSYVCRAFDQGVGRALWFITCANPEHIRRAIFRFSANRRADLWSGVGLACAYAGAASDATILDVAHAGIDYAAHIAQGVAFAVKTRLRAGNMVDHTVRACRLLCGLEVHEAAAITDNSLEGLKDTPRVPAYELWRRRIAARFTPGVPAPVI